MVLVCFLFSLAPAAAQNLLTNPDFSADLSGWDIGTATTHDASTGGSSGPGSALWSTMIDSSTVLDDLGIVSQCIGGVTPGTTYQFGGAFNLSSAPVGSSAVVILAWQDDPGCSNLISLVAAQPVTSTGSFQTSSGSAVAPAGAESVQVLAGSGLAPLTAGSIQEEDIVPVQGQYVVNADDMFLEAQAPVPTMGMFWLMALLALLLSLGILAVKTTGRRIV